MSLIGVKRSVDVGSDGMCALIRFIDRSMGDGSSNIRRLVADKQYWITMTTTRGNNSESSTLVIEKGAILLFHPRFGAHATNKDLLMVNANGHGWGISLIDGNVRYFKNEIHVREPSSVQLPSAGMTANRGFIQT
jgi:hypothetical protein